MAKIQIFGNILSYATPSASGDLVPKWYVDAMAENPGQTTMTIMTGTSIAPTQTGQVFYKEVTANTAFTLNASGLSAVNNEVCEFYLVINSSGNTVTFPSGWVWAGGSDPTIVEGTSIIHVFTTNAKSTWRAELLGAFPALANRIVFTVTVPANTEIDLGDEFYDTTLVTPVSVDWGDGSKETWSSGSIPHTFASAGTYTIIMKSANGKMPVLGFAWLEDHLISIDHADVEWYSRENYAQTNLVTVANMFWRCSNLTNVPDTLFSRNNNIGSFSSCFQMTGLEQIPEGLFSTNTQAQEFDYCFGDCDSLLSIPANLFSANTSATDFIGCFGNCSSLSSIPSGLFRNKSAASFRDCFKACSSLTSVPSDVFAGVTSGNFTTCFGHCTSLSTIPLELFDDVTSANFYNCFIGCSSLTPYSLPPYVIQLWEKDSSLDRNSYANTSATTRQYVPDAWGGTILPWSSSTTYSKGDWVWHTFGGVPKVYTYINDTSASNKTPGLDADYWRY